MEFNEMSNNYRNIYLKSNWWKNKRKKLIEKANNKCFYCGTNWCDSIWNQNDDGTLNEWLEVHHLSYKNLGKEKKEDLIVVCSLCHDELHEQIALKRYYKILEKNHGH